MDISETSPDWGIAHRFGWGVIVMSLIPNIKQTMHKLGISFKSLISLNRVKTNQNVRFLSFGGKIAFKPAYFEKRSLKTFT